MKTLAGVVMILAVMLAGYWVWGSEHARRMNGSATRIFIHGVPVCVMQRGGGIEAAVGDCPTLPERNAERGGGTGIPGHPFAHPRRALPPGHPPVGIGPEWNETETVRRIPI